MKAQSNVWRIACVVTPSSSPSNCCSCSVYSFVCASCRLFSVVRYCTITGNPSEIPLDIELWWGLLVYMSTYLSDQPRFLFLRLTIAGYGGVSRRLQRACRVSLLPCAPLTCELINR